MVTSHRNSECVNSALPEACESCEHSEALVGLALSFSDRRFVILFGGQIVCLCFYLPNGGGESFCSKDCLSSFTGPETQGGRPEL